MVRDTALYYDQMSSTVSRALRNMWEAEITRAESQRLRNPLVMDIIGAQEIHKAQDPNHSKYNNFFHWVVIRLAYFCRIDLQDRVRRLAKEPHEEAQTEVEQLRQRLTAEFLLLQTLPNTLNLIMQVWI